MEYVEICKKPGDCKNFSRLVMGTDHLRQDGWTADGQPALSETAAFEVLDEAAKWGINFFDTAPIYVGGVENMLGRWRCLRNASILTDAFYYHPNLNPDRRLYILSKGGFPFDLFWAQHLEAGTHSAELKDELVRLGVLALNDRETTPPSPLRAPLKNAPAGTYASRLFGNQSQITQRIAGELVHSTENLMGEIAIYLMHRDDGDAVAFRAVKRVQTPVLSIMRAIGSEQISKQFWTYGWSNWQTQRIEESAQLTAADPNLPKPAISSPYFSLFEMSGLSIHALGVQVTHAEMMDPNFQNGIKIMPYSPIGGFSILDQPEPVWDNAKMAAKSKFEKGDPYWQNVYYAIFTDANEARWNRVLTFTKTFNDTNGTSYTVDQMINAYALAHPRTDLLAIGAITVEQVRRTVNALQLAKELTPQDLNYLYDGTRK